MPGRSAGPGPGQAGRRGPATPRSRRSATSASVVPELAQHLVGVLVEPGGVAAERGRRGGEARGRQGLPYHPDPQPLVLDQHRVVLHLGVEMHVSDRADQRAGHVLGVQALHQLGARVRARTRRRAGR